MIEYVFAVVRGMLCELLGHRFVAMRRITPQRTLRTVYACQRCGVES